MSTTDNTDDRDFQFAGKSVKFKDVEKDWPPDRKSILRVIGLLGFQIANGVKFIDAIPECGRAISKPGMLFLLSETFQAYKEGESMASALHSICVNEIRAFRHSDLIINLIAVGEETGSLDQTCRLATRINEVTASAIRNAEAMGCSHSEAIGQFTACMAILLQAGLPPLRCLRIAQTHTDDVRVNSAIEELIIATETGLTLGEAFAKQSHVFGVECEIRVKCAEKTGSMEVAFAEMAGL